MDREQVGSSRPKRDCFRKFPNESEIQRLLDSEDEDYPIDFEDFGKEFKIN